MTSTIRTVPANLDDRGRPSFEEDVSSEWSPSVRLSPSVFSSSLNSNSSGLSTSSQHTPAPPSTEADPRPNVKLKQSKTGAYLDAPGAGTMEMSIRVPSSGGRRSFEVPQRESSLGVTKSPVANGEWAQGSSSPSVGARSVPPSAATNHNHTPTKAMQPEETQDGISLSAGEAHLSNGWDSTVGKAALGKTGRVINRLVSENEALKREIQIERLKAEESRQAARLLEDKMERMVSDYESRLLEANVTKTLLSRKERQVESLQAAVELEKKRTADAREKEKTWREEMEKICAESKRQVEQATTHAALMEGRYTAISSHWKDQGEEVEKALGRMRQEVAALLEERAGDDDKIELLRDLCDQQDANIKALLQQNRDVVVKFEEYKAEQERALQGIKTRAVEREAEQQRMLDESREVLHKLKWALNVKENVRGAQ